MTAVVELLAEAIHSDDRADWRRLFMALFEPYATHVRNILKHYLEDDKRRAAGGLPPLGQISCDGRDANPKTPTAKVSAATLGALRNVVSANATLMLALNDRTVQAAIVSALGTVAAGDLCQRMGMSTTGLLSVLRGEAAGMSDTEPSLRGVPACIGKLEDIVAARHAVATALKAPATTTATATKNGAQPMPTAAAAQNTAGLPADLSGLVDLTELRELVGLMLRSFRKKGLPQDRFVDYVKADLASAGLPGDKLTVSGAVANVLINGKAAVVYADEPQLPKASEAGRRWFQVICEVFTNDDSAYRLLLDDEGLGDLAAPAPAHPQNATVSSVPGSTSVAAQMHQLADDKARMVNGVLRVACNDDKADINDLIAKLNGQSSLAADLQTQLATFQRTSAEQIEELQRKLANRAPAITSGTVRVAGHDEPLTFKVVERPAHDIFPPMLGEKTWAPEHKRMMAFTLATLTWIDNQGHEVRHPMLPDVDGDYVFEPVRTMVAALAIKRNQKPWLTGPTGSGKSEWAIQFSALVGMPLFRFNFDSEISRLDLIGREVLTAQGGVTISKFVDGMLPQALSGPNLLLCDEPSYIRPDVAYVMQRALDDKGLAITEDGGRVVMPHPLMRWVAADNGRGYGDEQRLYQGMRPQSMAFMGRWKAMVPFPYLDVEAEAKVILARVPAIKAAEAKQLAGLAVEVREALERGEVQFIISLRNLVAAAEMWVDMKPLATTPEEARDLAVRYAVIERARNDDRPAIESLWAKVRA